MCLEGKDCHCTHLAHAAGTRINNYYCTALSMPPRADELPSCPLQTRTLIHFRVGLVCSGFHPLMTSPGSAACCAWMMSWLASWKQQTCLLTKTRCMPQSLSQSLWCQVRFHVADLLLLCSTAIRQMHNALIEHSVPMHDVVAALLVKCYAAQCCAVLCCAVLCCICCAVMPHAVPVKLHCTAAWQVTTVPSCSCCCCCCSCSCCCASASLTVQSCHEAYSHNTLPAIARQPKQSCSIKLQDTSLHKLCSSCSRGCQLAANCLCGTAE